VNSIEYLRPDTLDQLFEMMATHGSNARLLAGGTDLIVKLRKGPVGKSSARPEVVIDLKRIAALRSDVVGTATGVRIGARAVMTDIINDPVIQRDFPALRQAALVVGSVQIRNRATLAGNLCNASPAADTAPALLAYGARVNIIGAGGPRQIGLDQFFAGPGRTTLEPGEIVESVDIAQPPTGSGAAFLRLTRRHGVDLAIVSVCCVASSARVRFGLGAVGPRPFVVDAHINDFTPGHGDDTVNESAFRRLVDAASPISDLRARDDYRSAMLSVLARRALRAAVADSRVGRGSS
jgi:CO/xanthine dehydrogenase FAD-binding subunit